MKMSMITLLVKKHIILVTILVLSGCAHPRPAGAQVSTEAAEVELVPWGSSESTKRLVNSLDSSPDFFPLSNFFVSQDNGIICGLASSSIILNALRLGQREGLPVDRSSIAESERKFLPESYDPFFPKYTQNNVLTEKTKQKIEVLGKPIEIKGEMKKDFGLQLLQLAQILQAHGLDVAIRVVTDGLDSKAIRDELVKNLETKGDYVLVNYRRQSLGQPGGGHISPLGAYDEESDSFLVLDVNPNKAPWVWVDTDDLIAAMRTFDTVENRGYLLIKEGR